MLFTVIVLPKPVHEPDAVGEVKLLTSGWSTSMLAVAVAVQPEVVLVTVYTVVVGAVMVVGW